MNLCCVPLAEIRLCLPEFSRLHSCGFVRAPGITVWDAWEAEASRTTKGTAPEQAAAHVCCRRPSAHLAGLGTNSSSCRSPAPAGASSWLCRSWPRCTVGSMRSVTASLCRARLGGRTTDAVSLCFQPSQAPDSTASFTFHPVLLPKCLLFPVQTPAPQALVKIIQSVVTIRSTVGILWIQLFISPYSEGYSLRVRIKDYKEFQPLYAICVKNIVEGLIYKRHLILKSNYLCNSG